MKKIKIIALISGGGTNLQAIIDACSHLDFPAEVILVGADNFEAKGLERAKKSKIETFVVDYKKNNKRTQKRKYTKGFQS